MDKVPTMQGCETTENMGQDNEKLDCIGKKQYSFRFQNRGVY